MLSIRAAISGIAQILRGAYFSPGFPAVAFFQQEAPADASALLGGENPVRFFRAQNPGGSPIANCRFVATAPAAPGESVSVLLEVAHTDGTSESLMAAGAFVFGGAAGQAAGVVDMMPALKPGIRLLPGDALVLEWDYTASGGPNTMGISGLFVDYYGDPQP